ncbi:hypothetical protein FQA39_LY17688 [Lamprigera yunnana]|nr:hypothetical protein FQA39_LY17688 [Lamprigera yunnana]
MSSCNLTITEEELGAKTCIKNMFNSVSTNTTVVYVYEKVFDDLLPKNLQHPLVTIDASKEVYPNSKYLIYNEVVVLNVIDIASFNRCLIVLEQNGLWSSRSSPRRKHLIVYPSQNVSELKNIFTYFLEFDIIDVIVIAHNLSDTRVYTWNPYHPSNKCGKEFNFQTEDDCGFFNLSVVKRKQQFNKCDVAYVYQVDSDLDRQIDRVSYVSGFIFDVLIMDINATLIFKKGHRLKENKKGVYVRLNNLNRRCISEYSCSAVFDRNVFLLTVPPPKMINPMDVFKIVFKTHVWLLIFFTFVLTSIIWWLISWCNWGTSFTDALLKVYSLTIFSAMDKIPSIVSLRFIFIAYVLYAIHIQSIFTSNLVKLLTNTHFEPIIETLEQLAEAGLPILTVNSQIYHFRNTERYNELVYKKLAGNSYVINETEYINSMVNETVLKHNSLFISTILLYRMAHTHDIKFQVISDTDSFGVSCTLFASKFGTPLIISIDRIMTVLCETGLMTLKTRQFDEYMKKFKNKFKYDCFDVDKSAEAKVLSLTHVYPVFVFWGTVKKLKKRK